MDQPGLSYMAPPHLFWWVGLILALAGAFWAYYRLVAPLGRPLRLGLQLLRIAALLTLLFMLLEPVLTRWNEGSGRPTLAVLVDRSSSMRIHDRAERSRRDLAAEALVRLESKLGDEFALSVHGFADGLTPRAPADSTYPWDTVGATAMGEALEGILVKQAESPVGGIVLVTDGAHTVGKDPALVARNLSVPVFAVMLGDTLAPSDLLIRQVQVPAIGFAGEPIAVRTLLESAGLEGALLTLKIRERRIEGGRMNVAGPVIAEKELTLPPAAGREIEAALEVIPQRVGLALYEITATVAQEERITINNLRLFAVDVREKKTRILYIEGEPDWDFSFLKRTLDVDTTLSYSYLVREPDGGMTRYGAAGPEDWPRRRADLAPYAAVILGRCGPSDLPAETVDALQGFLRDGGGIMLLGAEDLSAWQIVWGEILPVVVRPERRRGLSPSIVGVSLTGLSHEITATGESSLATERAWSALPPIWIPEGHYVAAPGALVLLTAQTTQPEREVPLLALAQTGGGRLGVLTGRGHWRWDFVMGAVSREDPVARPFWKRMMRWLAEPSQPEAFKVTPLRHVFQDSEAPAFTASLRDEAFQPIAGARITLAIEAMAASTAAPGLSIHLYPDGSAGKYGGSAASLAPGMYRFAAEATVPGGDGVLHRSEGLFWVEQMGPEFFELAASRRLPRLLARSSGGIAVEPSQLDDLTAAVPDQYRRLRIAGHAELWNDWRLFVFLIVVLAAEWILRRRKGLA